ncbi:MAG: anthranilate phosphoribosyltransferase [Rhodospirillaceae bacterium]|jgi:anthranilate phosphoribosyltransferase|nr:anthranilate phosphoribosyltransferase [Rhodospirillaceae bacterium]MBT5194662.1 anthranilate phosphoribosyltransferase [Rhodospirillaceae bacterium]MBT5459618.1 anthranilate phosphoribosyltransferase [Rhodospirillaceae bacterium]MBT5897241.1 anthranilate phosphoribosyltransferase [Rhodospirillaceae bacterium]MBT7755689.1 anthranilate phosphoribosyltransferase [Rhodospirillaceae bacterium]
MADDKLDFKALIAIVADGQALNAEQARAAFDVMMSGDATPSQMGAFLMALRVRGESVAEITGGVMAMRQRMTTIMAPADAMDIVGTGGDGKGTLNISTATAFVVAGCGVPIAKHGNRAASSKSGTTDVQSALGINVDADFPILQQALDETGLCFMAAQRHHGAMRNIGPTRVEIGTRTIFNILGPMTNPAGVKRQLIGVFAREWMRPMAETLKTLGSERVWIVHGSDGSDEITTTGPTYVATLSDGEITEFEISPDQAGLPMATLADLQGGEAAENAAALTNLLEGGAGAYRDIVLFNAAAALMIAGKASDLPEGVAMATRSIDDGQAMEKLQQLVEITNRADTVSP